MTLLLGAPQGKSPFYQVWWLQIAQDHVMKRSCAFMGRSPLRQVTFLQYLVVIATLIVEFYSLLVVT